MKKKTRKIPSVFLCLLMVATVFAVAAPMNVSADSDEVPFKGNFDGSNVPSGHPAWERIEVSGQASHLGKYNAVVEAYMPGGVIIDWDPSGFPIIRLPTTATFTSANGDELYANMDLVGMYHLIDLNFPSFTLSSTITGGTGRFEGATGSFSGAGGQITMPGEDSDLVRGTFFAGTISTVGSNK